MPLEVAAEDQTRRLVEQYTEIASLAGGLAHEIRNPLSTIRLNLELLAEELERSELPRDRRARAKIRVVQRECQHLEDILKDFLRFACVKDLRRQPENLNDVVEEMINFYSPQAAQHKIEVLPYLSADLPLVPLDRQLFEHALLNLIFNAQQAMPDGGQLVLRTFWDAEHVKLELIDTGCGMDAETLRQAFRPFYSTKRDGNGLGLPTARKIIEAHGGTIEAQSEVGKGTRFAILLPGAETGAAPRCEATAATG